MSYGGASPALSDRKRYPRLFRLHPQASQFNLARIALARHFKWKKVATLNVAMDYFSAVILFFNDLFHIESISYLDAFVDHILYKVGLLGM